MEALLNRLTGLNYDLFGVIFPGLISTIVLVSIAIFNIYITGTFEVNEYVNIYSTLKEDYLYISLLFLLLLSYLLGYFLFWVTKNGIFPTWLLGPEKLRIWITSFKIIKVLLSLSSFRFLLFLGDSNKNRDNYNSKYEDIRVVLSLKLSEKLKLATSSELNDWSVFYVFAKNYIISNHDITSMPGYQNKYTFHRSLAGLFSLSFWLSLVYSLILYFKDSVPSSAWIMFAISIASFSLMRLFISSYKYYWSLLGNIVISELAVQLEKNK